MSYPPQSGYPPQPGYPPAPGAPAPPFAAYPQQGYPPQGYPPQGYPPPNYAPQGYPPQPTPAYGAPGAGAMPMPMPMPMPNPVMMVAGAPGAAMVGHDILSTLRGLPGLFVKQEVRFLDAVGLCEQSNRYSVEAWDPRAGAAQASQGRTPGKEQLLRFREVSNCVARQVCLNKRGFTMAFYGVDRRIPTAVPDGADPLMSQDALVLERPFKCTIACFWRPLVRVKHNTLGYLGEIYNPFTWLNWVLEIRTPTPCDEPTARVSDYVQGMGKSPGTVLWRIRGDICQWGMWLPPLPVGGCSKVEFTIHTADDETFSRPVGSICKIWSGCLKEMFTESDNFTVAFPAGADEVQKGLIASAAILIDFLMFEAQGNKNDNSGIDVVNMLT